MKELLIKGGRVIDPANSINDLLDVFVKDGKIIEVAKGIQVPGAKVYDATGKLVVPGLIDIHVHLREPGYEYKETIASGTRAAARGGFTSIACMPNTNPVADNQSVIKLILDKSRTEGVVNVYPVGAVTKGSQSKELAEIGELREAGAVALSDDGQPVTNSQVMRLAMEYARMYNLTILSHCEEKELVGEGVMNEGYYSTILGLKGIPRTAEETMTARDLLIAEYTGCPIHICHVSTKGAVEIIRQAKARGVKVTAEATPHHFTLTDAAVVGFDTNTKVNPPLRTDDDVTAVKEGLRDGTIDAIATDHAPHALDEKDLEYNYAANGMIGLETAIGLVFEELVSPGILTLEQAVAKLTVNPAKIIGIDRGNLTVGTAADITVIDPEFKEEIKKEELASKSFNTPFLGRTLKGLPVLTIVGGNIVMQDRRLLV